MQLYDSDVSAYRVPMCKTCGAWDAHQACVIDHALRMHRFIVTDIVLTIVRVGSAEEDNCLEHMLS